MKKGGVKTKDNKWIKFPFSGGSSGIKRANLAATEESNVFWASDDGMCIVQDIEDDARMRNEGMTDEQLDQLYDEAVEDEEPSAMQAIMDGSNADQFHYVYPSERDAMQSEQANLAQKRARENIPDEDAKRSRVQSAQSILERVRSRAEAHAQR